MGSGENKVITRGKREESTTGTKEDRGKEK